MIFGIFKLNAQDWNWAKSFGGEQTEIVGAMAIDTDGAVLMAGNYRGMVNFGATTIEALEGSDAFLSKLDDQGNVQWAVSGGSLNNDVSIDVEVDDQGDVFWLGQFWIEAYFENDTIQAGTNAKAYFIAKYTEGGNLIWVEPIIGTGLKVASDLAIDAFGDIMVTGYFSDSLEVDELVLEAENEEASFLFKMTSEGDVVWGKTYGETGQVQAKKIEKTSNGDFIIAGDLIGKISLGSDTLVSVSSDFDIFIGRVDADGNGLWGRIGTGVFDNLLNGLVLDEDNNIYVSGSFVGVLGIGGVEILTPGFTDNLYLLKINEIGEVLWARGLSSEEFNDPSFSLDIDLKDDLVMMIGQFEGDLLVDELSISNEDAVSGFIGGFNRTNGLVQQLDKIKGTDQSSGLDIEVGDGAVIYVTGVFFETVSFDDFDLGSNGGADVFVAQASDLFTNVYFPDITEESINVYPNPTSEFLQVSTEESEFELRIIDALGRVVFFAKNQKVLNIAFLSSGTYFLSYRNQKFIKTVAFIKE